MWVLALGGVFLATTQACILCQLSARDLSGRLAHMCGQVEAKWKDCGASWNFPAFALGELRHPGTVPEWDTPGPQPSLDALASPLGGPASAPGKPGKTHTSLLSPQMRCP